MPLATSNSSDLKEEAVDLIPIEAYDFEIDEQSKKIYESVYGEKTLELAHIFRCIECESTRETPIPPHVLYQLILSFFKAIKSQDPLAFHQNLSRKVLESEYKGKEIPSSEIDLLSREICENLNAIGDKLFPIQLIEKNREPLEEEARKQYNNNAALNILETDDPEADKKCFDSKKQFIPLKILLTFMEITGESGKERAKKIREREVAADPAFWFPNTNQREEGEHFFHSAAFVGLTRILWHDKVKKRLKFNEKFPPSTIQPTFEKLGAIINSKKDESTPDMINLIYGTEIAGRVEIPLVPSHLLNKVFKGVEKFHTVTFFRTLKKLVSLPYEQKLKGIEDFRVKEYDGGFVEFGSEIGISNKKFLIELREVLYALKYLEIPNLKESRITNGRLIDLAHYRSPKTGREDGLIVTILPNLVGYGEVDCTGMLLIPVATLAPPVHEIASNQFHAGLYYLQMILLQEFSEKSKEFYLHKCIQISDDDWNRLLIKANIPLKHKERIIEGWTVDGIDAPRVLENVGKNNYKLGEEYEKISVFILGQGEFRIIKSQEGKSKAAKKKNKNP